MELLQTSLEGCKMAEKKDGGTRKKPEPVIEWGVNLGGLFTGLGEFIGQVAKLAEKAELENTGVSVEPRRPPHGMYGVSVRVGPTGPVLSRFGTIKPTLEPGAAEVREPLVDIFENEKKITVIAELPGAEEKDIKVEVEGRTLKISAGSKDRKYSKEVELPAAVTAELESTYTNGVLELKLKKKVE
jgi:HSP20 family protein